jgi:hypothetical protein
MAAKRCMIGYCVRWAASFPRRIGSLGTSSKVRCLRRLALEVLVGGHGLPWNSDTAISLWVEDASTLDGQRHADGRPQADVGNFQEGWIADPDANRQAR